MVKIYSAKSIITLNWNFLTVRAQDTIIFYINSINMNNISLDQCSLANSNFMASFKNTFQWINIPTNVLAAVITNLTI